MEKLQIAKFTFLLIFLLLIPFVSSSLRSSYLYLLLNLLIVALGVEAGFLSCAPPREEKKQLVASFATPAAIVGDVAFGLRGAPNIEVKYPEQRHHHHREHQVKILHSLAKPAPAEQKLFAADKKMATAKTTAKMQTKLKRQPSRPSLFFIGGPEVETTYGGCTTAKESDGDYEEERWEEAAGVLTKQELFAKSENFIGNFYKQLKMQREESWKKIHGLYHRAF